jgi:hypothetical protein
MADKKSTLENVFEAIAIKPGYPKGKRWFGEQVWNDIAGASPAAAEGRRSAPRRRNDPALSRAPKSTPVESTKSVESSSKAMKNPTQRAYDKYNPNYSGAGAPLRPGVKPPIPKAKPAVEKPRSTGKSKTRIAFEQEFAKQRKAGKKEFTFRGKRYTTKLK